MFFFCFIEKSINSYIMKDFKLLGFGLKQMLAIAVVAVVAVMVYDNYIGPKISGISTPNVEPSND